MTLAGNPQPSLSVAAVFRPGDTRDDLVAFLDHIRSMGIRALTGVVIYDASGQGEALELPDDLPVAVRRGYWDEDLGRARNDALEMSMADWSLVLDVHDRLVGDPGDILRSWNAAHAAPPDVGVVHVTLPGERFRLGRLIRRGRTSYVGAEAEIVASVLHADRRCIPLDPVAFAIESNRGRQLPERTRHPRRLRRLLDEVAQAEKGGDERLPALLFELAAEHHMLGDITAALQGYRRLDEADEETSWTWAAREASADLLISQGRLDEAHRVVVQLEAGPNPDMAWWLRVNLHLARGDDRAALENLREQRVPSPVVGSAVPEAVIVRERFAVASRLGASHEMLVALLALMTGGLEIEGRGSTLLRLWGKRPLTALAEVIADTATPHLEEIAAELASVSGQGRQVARELRARRRRYSVAAVVIARDEARCIQRCVESVLPWVDEVLVADTGSEDDTPALAASAGARVVHVPWTDDFSAARNAALDAAHADWHVILDADEVIAAGGKELRDLAQVAPEVVMAVNVVSSFRLADGLETEAEAQSRILPGTVRYRGIVHARPDHDLPVNHVRVTIEHDGYEPEQLADKLPRRERLLRRAVEAEPNNDYLRYQLARNLETQGRMDEAAAEYDRINVDELSPEPWHHILVVQRAHTLTSVGRAQEALDFLLGQAARFDASPDFHFVLGNVLVDVAAARPDMAGEALPLAVTEFRRCLAIGEREDLAGHVSGRGGHLAERNLQVVIGGCRNLGLAVPSEDGSGDSEGEDSAASVRSVPDCSLDVVMIVKNEEERLGNALESCASLRPLLGDICVYDTGSTDSTRDIARSYGARVVEGFWDDNYSRARNAAAAMSEAPWLLVLDADERVFAEPGALGRELAAADDMGAEVLYVEAAPTNGAAGEVQEYWMSPRLYRPDLARYARPVHAELRRRDGRRFFDEHHLPPQTIRIENDGFDADRQAASLQRALHLTEVAREVHSDQADALAAYVDRARARWGGGDSEGARVDLRTALSMGARTTYYPWAFQWLVRLELETGNLDEAAEELEHLRAMSPSDSYTRWLEANLHLARGQASDALRILERLGPVVDAIGLPLADEVVAEATLRAARQVGDDLALARSIHRLAAARGDAEMAEKAARAAGLRGLQ